MDNITQRRIVALAGVIIALLGLCSFLYGMLEHDQIFQLLGFFSIIIAYGLMLVVKKLREKDTKEKAEAAGKD